MPRGGRRAGAGRRAGHGFRGHGIGGHGLRGHGIGGRGIGGHHFHNHNFHHGNNLFNNRRRHHGGNFNHGAANFAIHWDNQNTVTVTGGTGMAVAEPRSSNAGCLVILPVLGMLCFIIGSVLGYRGLWTNSVIGYVGIFVIGLGGVFWGIFILIVCCLGFNRSNTPEPTLEAGAAPDPNLTVPTMTLQGGVTTPSLGGDDAVFVIQTNGVLPGGFTMAPQSFNIHAAPSGTTQSVQQMLQNFTGLPNPATNILATAPPITNPIAHPPPPAANGMGVAEPAPKVENIPPPPSYDDVVTGRKKYDE